MLPVSLFPKIKHKFFIKTNIKTKSREGHCSYLPFSVGSSMTLHSDTCMLFLIQHLALSRAHRRSFTQAWGQRQVQMCSSQTGKGSPKMKQLFEGNTHCTFSVPGLHLCWPWTHPPRVSLIWSPGPITFIGLPCSGNRGPDSNSASSSLQWASFLLPSLRP